VKKALILDADLEYAFWLCRGLDQAGYEAFPSKGILEAATLLEELQVRLDLVVVSMGLPGAGAFVAEIRRSHNGARVVAFSGEPQAVSSTTPQIDVYCRRPDRGNDLKRQEWVERVGALLPVSVLPGLGLRLEPDRRVAPTPNWKQWEGAALDGQFQLKRLLGRTAHSAVFLTEVGNADSRAATIKVVPCQGSIPLLPYWERAAELAHPGLTQIFDGGLCRFEDLDVEYVVMEYADENLADVLRQRALEAGEAREMLEPVLETLAGVHAHGYVLGHLKPSNILSVGDQVKLAADGLRPAGHAHAKLAGPYDAPERAPLSPAADVWALGVTVVEALTQHPPQRPWLKFLKPVLPPKMPGLFVDIARDCLQPNPARRESVAGLATRLRQPLPIDLAVGPVHETPEMLADHDPSEIETGLGDRVDADAEPVPDESAVS